MYILETRYYRDSGKYCGEMLHDMTAREWGVVTEGNPDRRWYEPGDDTSARVVRYERVDATFAHRYVRADRVHNTLLWICDGRIRKA